MHIISSINKLPEFSASKVLSMILRNFTERDIVNFCLEGLWFYPLSIAMHPIISVIQG